MGISVDFILQFLCNQGCRPNPCGKGPNISREGNDLFVEFSIHISKDDVKFVKPVENQLNN